MMLLISVRSTALDAHTGNWTTDLSRMKMGLNLPVKDSVETVKTPPLVLLKRMKNPWDRESVEVPSINLPSESSALQNIARLIALPGRERDVFRMFREASASNTRFSFHLTDRFFSMVEPKRLIEEFFSHKHHRIELATTTLQSDSSKTIDLLRQLRPFFSREELVSLYRKIGQAPFLELDSDLLPSFPRQAVGKFSYFNGPNCFHAALAFQDPSIPKLQYLNAKREKAHHWQMINYDELWRILSNSFYEIEPEQTSLNYGDLLVFFDLPVDEHPPLSIDFRWIRHVSVYLFNRYTFSKGSKSANSTYTVNLLEEEWNRWKRRTKNFAIKIFRKSSRRVTTLPHEELYEWLY